MAALQQENAPVTVVVGLGKTGLSCVRFLTERGERVVVVDSRQNPPGLEELRRELPEVEVYLGAFDAAQLSVAAQLVISPGVPLRDPAIAEAIHNGVPVAGDVELFAQQVTAPVVAITGSNGKSTVTTLMGEMVQAAGRTVGVGGNIGTPVLDLLNETAELYVLELSSFQLETTHSLNAAAAVVLNVSADHMDRYTDLEEYAAAKQVVYHGDGVMVLNADDPVVMAMAETGRNVVRFSLSEPGADDFGLREKDGVSWLARGEELLLSVDELKIPGKHNIANALAALALGDAIGLPMDAMCQALCDFKGLSHRTQWVANHNGINWYNDSKGTNVGATLAAINGLSEPLVLIAGGEGKGQDFAPLKAALQDKARAVVLIGRDAVLIEAALAGVVPVVHATDMAEAVMQAAELAQAGDSVLLSPACASFDMFSGYEERGRVFMDEVRRLAS